MAEFPAIAEYAFLSDCEVNALVAPDGAVEWLCLPRPDAPSVFGAVLDRSAGFFHFGPSTARIPDQRRYLPGTNVLETTFHTASGWMTLTDLLVIGPESTQARRNGWRRVPEERVAQCTLLRLATCVDGRIEIEANCLPLFDYGRTPGVWSYEGDGYERLQVRCGDLSLQLRGSMRLGAVGARAYGRASLEKGETA